MINSIGIDLNKRILSNLIKLLIQKYEYNTIHGVKILNYVR